MGTEMIKSIKPSFVDQEKRAENILVASTNQADEAKLKDYIPSKCTEVNTNWNRTFAQTSQKRYAGYLANGYNQIGCDSRRVGIYSGSMDTGLLFVQQKYLRDKARLQSYVDEEATS